MTVTLSTTTHVLPLVILIYSVVVVIVVGGDSVNVVAAVIRNKHQ